MTNIYREPDPLMMWTMRASDAYPMGPDHAEVVALNREARWTITGVHVIDPETARQVSPEEFIALGPEQFASHEEYMAARDLEQWGYNPFTEYEE